MNGESIFPDWGCTWIICFCSRFEYQWIVVVLNFEVNLTKLFHIFCNKKCNVNTVLESISAPTFPYFCLNVGPFQIRPCRVNLKRSLRKCIGSNTMQGSIEGFGNVTICWKENGKEGEGNNLLNRNWVGKNILHCVAFTLSKSKWFTKLANTKSGIILCAEKKHM